MNRAAVLCLTATAVMMTTIAGLSRAAPPAPRDLDAFWRTTLARLSPEPIDPEVTPIHDPVPYAPYRVTFRSLDGVRIHARLALPVQGEASPHPWPLIVTAPGYGGEQQGVMLAECQRGYAVLQVFPRGQGDSADAGNLKGDKLTARLDSPDGAYYQGAYADVIRAIDFAVSRAAIDPDRIALVGTSQGGGIALAVASLDPRVKAAVAHLPFLCDLRQAAQSPSLVKTLLDKAHRNDQAALQTLDYFDPLQLVPRCRARVLISAGGKDETCPASTIQAVYDRIPANTRTLKIYPTLAHTSCVDFYNLSWAWLDRTLRDPSR